MWILPNGCIIYGHPFLSRYRLLESVSGVATCKSWQFILTWVVGTHHTAYFFIGKDFAKKKISNFKF
jgi:hypothetical protein